MKNSWIYSFFFSCAVLVCNEQLKLFSDWSDSARSTELMMMILSHQFGWESPQMTYPSAAHLSAE